MRDEQQKLRQLKAAVRLRTFQRERAELQLSQARQGLREAEHRLQAEAGSYHRILVQHQQLMGRGSILDPALQEQRLLALVGVRAEIARYQRQVVDARTQYQAARAGLMQARLDADVVEKARQHAVTAIDVQAHAKELVDIFDAQQSQGGAYGH